jgi:hypothetical protein
MNNHCSTMITVALYIILLVSNKLVPGLQWVNCQQVGSPCSTATSHFQQPLIRHQARSNLCFILLRIPMLLPTHVRWSNSSWSIAASNLITGELNTTTTTMIDSCMITPAGRWWDDHETVCGCYGMFQRPLFHDGEGPGLSPPRADAATLSCSCRVCPVPRDRQIW